MNRQQSLVYVTVEVRMSRGTYPVPQAIIWPDGRRFGIERLIGVASGTVVTGNRGERYTVLVRGQRRYLWFEHNPGTDSPDVGWWYVERKGVA